MRKSIRKDENSATFEDKNHMRGTANFAELLLLAGLWVQRSPIG